MILFIITKYSTVSTKLETYLTTKTTFVDHKCSLSLSLLFRLALFLSSKLGLHIAGEEHDQHGDDGDTFQEQEHGRPAVLAGKETKGQARGDGTN